MILNDIELANRLDSPDNLINRLRALTSSSKREARENRHPSLPPTADELIDNLEDKLAISSVRSKANSVLAKALTELDNRITEADKPEKLARIAESMTKVVESTTPKHDKSVQIGQIVIYSPQARMEDDYDVIDIQHRKD